MIPDRAEPVSVGNLRRIVLVVAAGVVALSACGEGGARTTATPTPPVAVESTPTSEPTPVETPPATPDATPGPALPPLPGAGADGQPIKTEAYSLEDYATDVGKDGSRTRRGQGSESSIVSLTPGESFYVTFSVTLNFGIVQIAWSSVGGDSRNATPEAGRTPSGEPGTVASGTAQIALDEGTALIGPVRTAIALQIQSSDTGSRWTLRFGRVERQ
ncbi:MAG: hypothetical protein OXG65_01610 [Chloroflexi bacterium]|nr:hypothetical protein [Chloroflexota bacterium]